MLGASCSAGPASFASVPRLSRVSVSDLIRLKLYAMSSRGSNGCGNGRKRANRHRFSVSSNRQAQCVPKREENASRLANRSPSPVLAPCGTCAEREAFGVCAEPHS